MALLLEFGLKNVGTSGPAILGKNPGMVIDHDRFPSYG
jgi:hypothetical protein